MSDVFMRFHKPPYPMQIFNDEQPALEWPAQFLPHRDASSANGGLKQ
jgi:hypothetical protein